MKNKTVGNKGEVFSTKATSLAEENKALGDEAYRKGDPGLAIKYYTKAINDSNASNHVYYSNRSAANLTMGNADSALEDANHCIRLNPEFAKGYCRRGAALHVLQRFQESRAAYMTGLELHPDDDGLKQGLASVKQDATAAAESSRSTEGKPTTQNDQEGNRTGDSTSATTTDTDAGPGLWKLTGRKIRKFKFGKIALDGIRDGLDATQRSVSNGLDATSRGSSPRGIDAVQQDLQFLLFGFQGEVKLQIYDEFKMYEPLERVKGVIRVNLKKPLQAKALTVTLKATRQLNPLQKEEFFHQELELCGSQVYPINGEYALDVGIPRLQPRPSSSKNSVGGMFSRSNERHSIGPATWTISASLASSGGAWTMVVAAFDEPAVQDNDCQLCCATHGCRTVRQA
eukprot:scaffold1284_cov108-Cylindrotheca_fusiformis.AAC.10